jgi:inosine-uridine nucleoside N-ribohydrolase
MRGINLAARLLVGLAIAALVVGCSGSASTSGGAAGEATDRTPVIVDTDMGADDVMALLYLLRDPSVSVRAIVVSGTGLAHASNGAQVASDLMGALGVGDIPLGTGSTTPMDGSRAFPEAWRSATDAGYGLALKTVPVSSRPAADVISEIVRSSATPVTVLTLGPLTDLGQALAAEPSLTAKIAHVHVSGGAITVSGNVAAEGGDPAATAAEWNLWIDPKADDIVLRSGIPITLVPLDATGKLPLTPAFLDELAMDHKAAGADIAYELLARSGSLLAGNFFWDQLATVLLTDPSAATSAEARLKAVTDGAASGSLVQDASGTALSYALTPDAARFESRFLEGLRRGEPRADPFTLAGTIHATFDGSTCGGTPTRAVAPGSYAVDFKSTVAGDTTLAVIRLHPGATWQQLLDFITAKGPQPADLSPPDFVDVLAAPAITGPGTVSAAADLTPGTYGIVCLWVTKPSATPASAPFEVHG